MKLSRDQNDVLNQRQDENYWVSLLSSKWSCQHFQSVTESAWRRLLSIWTQQPGLSRMVQRMFNSDSFHTWGISTFQTHRFISIIFVHLSLYQLVGLIWNYFCFLSVGCFEINMSLWSPAVLQCLFCVTFQAQPCRWQHLSFVRVYVRKFCIFAGWAAARHEMLSVWG